MTGIIKTNTLCYLADAQWCFSQQIHGCSNSYLPEIISAALSGDGMKTGGEAPAGHHSGTADLVQSQISVEIAHQKGQRLFDACGSITGGVEGLGGENLTGLYGA